MLADKRTQLAAQIELQRMQLRGDIQRLRVTTSEVAIRSWRRTRLPITLGAIAFAVALLSRRQRPRGSKISAAPAVPLGAAVLWLTRARAAARLWRLLKDIVPRKRGVESYPPTERDVRRSHVKRRPV
jgi:hypothetical protein